MFQLDLETGLQATKDNNELLKKKDIGMWTQQVICAITKTIATHYLCTTKNLFGRGGGEGEKVCISQHANTCKNNRYQIKKNNIKGRSTIFEYHK